MSETASKTLTGWLLEQIEATEAELQANRERGRNTSARLLVSCSAHRAIAVMHELIDQAFCASCYEYEEHPEPYPCPTLRKLAGIYVDRPGYRKEWSA